MMDSPDELELLRQRYLKRLQADSVTADNAPQPELGMLLATGLLDVGAKANHNRPMEIMSGIGNLAPTGGSTDNQAKYLQTVKDQQTRARQNALDDIKPISSIQGMIDAKNAKELAAKSRRQDIGMKGFAIGPDDAVSMVPGGVADIDLKHKNAQAQKDAAMADYYLSGKGNQAQNRMDFTKETQLEKQANQIHTGVVAKLQRDPILKQKLTQLQNLSSALSNFDNADHPTPQSFDELQQAVRANLGIKGSSGIGEREHTTMNSLGLNTARMMQFATGNPQDIAKDAGFAKHIKDLVKLEQKNIKSQVEKHLGTLTAGHASMYSKYPALKADLEDLTSAYGGEFNVAPVKQAVDPAMIQEAKRRGLIP